MVNSNRSSPVDPKGQKAENTIQAKTTNKEKDSKDQTLASAKSTRSVTNNVTNIKS